MQSTVSVRAPGRVNLIGEHTDYSHLPVMPIAIDRSLVVTARATGTPEIVAGSAAFPGEVAVSRADFRLKGGAWGRYLAGVAREMQDLAQGRGAILEISGDLPIASGLSSSSAFTVGVIAALNAAWDLGLDREAIAGRATAAERHTGVETGGMDQSVISFAEAGCALRIEFAPPERRPIPIPAGLAFVVASSGEPAPKSGAFREAYNERVIGTRLAAALLCEMIGIDAGVHPRLGDLSEMPEADLLVEELPERSSPVAVAASTGILAESLAQLSNGAVNPRTPVPVKRFARHVISERDRVDEAEAALLAGDLRSFGLVIHASHQSLKAFGCSTPALDAVCAAMKKAGAFGARLTGAGFGGYALAAVAPERVERVVAAAAASTGGPAFEVRASAGYTVE